MKWHLILLTWIGLVKIIWASTEICLQLLFSFLDEYRLQGYKILIHCNQGESRAPTIGLLYIARLGHSNMPISIPSVQKLKEIYLCIHAKRNIFLTVKSLWRDFVQNPVEEVNT